MEPRILGRLCDKAQCISLTDVVSNPPPADTEACDELDAGLRQRDQLEVQSGFCGQF